VRQASVVVRLQYLLLSPYVVVERENLTRKDSGQRVVMLSAEGVGLVLHHPRRLLGLLLVRRLLPGELGLEEADGGAEAGDRGRVGGEVLLAGLLGGLAFLAFLLESLDVGRLFGCRDVLDGGDHLAGRLAVVGKGHAVLISRAHLRGVLGREGSGKSGWLRGDGFGGCGESGGSQEEGSYKLECLGLQSLVVDQAASVSVF